MRIRIEYRAVPQRSPLTPWVHRGIDAPWFSATQFDPPLPARVDRLGYPIWIVEHRARELVFASPHEILAAIEVLGRRVLPTSRQLGASIGAVNSHWLSRLHHSWKPWKVRQQLVRRLSACLAAPDA